MLIFDVNVYGPFRVNQTFLAMLIESGGRITVISSISASIPGDSGLEERVATRQTMKEPDEVARAVLELDHDQPYAYDRDGLVALVDELMSQAGTKSE